MPNLIIPPNTTNFNNQLPDGTLSVPVISIPAFIFNNVAYPFPTIQTLAEGQFALPASGTVTLLAVGATQRAFITHIAYKSTIATPVTLRFAATDAYHIGSNLTTEIVVLDHSHPFNMGAVGDDLIMFNTAAAAATLELTILGFLLTP